MYGSPLICSLVLAGNKNTEQEAIRRNWTGPSILNASAKKNPAPFRSQPKRNSNRKRVSERADVNCGPCTHFNWKKQFFSNQEANSSTPHKLHLHSKYTCVTLTLAMFAVDTGPVPRWFFLQNYTQNKWGSMGINSTKQKSVHWIKLNSHVFLTIPNHIALLKTHTVTNDTASLGSLSGVFGDRLCQACLLSALSSFTKRTLLGQQTTEQRKTLLTN